MPSNPFWEGEMSELAMQCTAGEDIILDKKLVLYEIKSLIAHITMLEKQKLIGSKKKNKLIKALAELEQLHMSGNFKLDPNLEDVHSNVENWLIEKLGIDVGGSVRLAIARNDQVYTDLRLYYKDVLNEIILKLKNMISKFTEVASEHTKTIMPGYTHMRVSQSITYGFYLTSKCYHFLDDINNLNYDLVQFNKCPLGIFEMAGTHANIDRKLVSDLLGFSDPTEHALYTANQRGEIEIKLMADLGLIALHIKRFMNELMLFSTHEFGFFEINEFYSTGGTAQPNLKNPDTLEVIRANCAKIIGAHSQLMLIMDSLITGYNRDTQETKGIMFKAFDLILPSIDLTTEIVTTLKLNKEKMFSLAQINNADAPDHTIELALKKGISFREAYVFIKQEIKSGMFRGKVMALDRNSLGGTAPEQVKKMIADLKQICEEKK